MGALHINPPALTVTIASYPTNTILCKRCLLCLAHEQRVPGGELSEFITTHREDSGQSVPKSS